MAAPDAPTPALTMSSPSPSSPYPLRLQALLALPLLVLPLVLAPAVAWAAPATEAEMNLYTRIAAVNVCIARGAGCPSTGPWASPGKPSPR